MGPSYVATTTDSANWYLVVTAAITAAITVAVTIYVTKRLSGGG
jgi:hypothetical protein